MSLRNLRKMMLQKKMMETPDEPDDGEYEPLYAKQCVNAFAGITLSDSGTSKEESSDGNDSDKEEKTSKRKKKKRSRKNKKARRRACNPAEEDELPDIDALQSTSSALVPSTAEQSKVEMKSEASASKDDIRAVDVRKLNARNELNKLFGPDSDEERPRNRKRVPNLRRIHKQVIIMGDAMQITGLSMDLLDNIDGKNYFVFRHSKRYTDNHISYLDSTNHRDLPSFYVVKYKHVEAQLELAQYLFLRGGYAYANKYLERAIYKMEVAFHPMFRLADIKTRLEYRFIENRTFHVAMLTYVHMLTNRACHRTALELAKVLMNLDPSDPLAVIFIVDVIAIRAREFEWLIKAIEFWKKERSADEMFNIKYSNAYAHFQLAKDNASKKKAKKLLQEAILSFPRVALHILELTSVPEASQLARCQLFSSLPETLEINERMRDLYLLYARFVQGKWSLTENKQWLVTTATELAEKCDNDVDMQAMAVLAIRRAAVVLRSVPVEVERHLCVIKPMAALLIDEEFPEVRVTRFSDPLPDEMTTIDRYGYKDHNSVYSASRNRQYLDLITSFPLIFRHSPMNVLPPEDMPHNYSDDDSDESLELD